jgi:rhodanese-related sulfurtransferase
MNRKTVAFSIVLVLALMGAFLQSCATTAPKEMTAQQMLSQAKDNIAVVTPAQAKMNFDQGGYLFIDVRDPNEYKMGHIPNAVNISRGLLEFRIASQVPDKNAKLVVYCKTGGRSALATETLGSMGYVNVASMDGGWEAWSKDGYPVE